MRACGKLVHLLAGDAFDFAYVLGSLTHRDVHVGDSLRWGPRWLTTGCACLGALTRSLEDRIRCGVACATGVAADGFDTGSDEAITLACLDGMRRHANGLQARRAVAIDGDAGDIVQSSEHGNHACDVETTLTCRLTATHDEILDIAGLYLWHFGHEGPNDLRAHVVGAQVDERTFVGATNGATGGCDDDCFGHDVILSNSCHGTIRTCS